MSAGPAVDAGRRRFAALFASFGVAGAFPEAVWAALEEKGKLTRADLAACEEVSGVEFTDPERDLMLEGLEELRADYLRLRSIPLDNDVAPALRFDPSLPGRPAASGRGSGVRLPRTPVARPTDLEALAFEPVSRLAELVRSRQVSSVELTRMYLDRLKRYDSQLHCVITLTEELAERQARRADAELAAGTWRGPLHGIPWGAKDLISARGYRTTWGAKPFEDQVLDVDASVVRRLEQAGAVLVAKLSVGALAWGDVWFGGMTRNPWKPDQGSSGSSAGPAAAVAAGLVGFSIGSETWGSIVSPATRCGVTGLRPTFGRVGRYGAMALSWSMDKLGPLCRSVDDCALVLEAIHGADGLDACSVDVPFDYDPGGAALELRRLRVGFVRSVFEAEPEPDDDEGSPDAAAARAAAREWRRIDLESLDVLRGLGIELVPVELPDLPVGALGFILTAEAGAAFDDLTHSGRDELMVRQVEQAWPNVFRQAHMIPAIEYVQANRVRSVVMRETERAFDGLDVVVSRSFGGDQLLLTNLTGHPAVVVPNGFRSDGTPTSLSFLGRLYGEAPALAVARAFQQATGVHRRHPKLG